MLTITIFAAGLVCLAGVLGLRLGRAQAQVSAASALASADERGITLQTLIVTAVLVLMAVAAGVVIVAITNNAAEDLEQANPSIESNCEDVEIYNPVLAANGKKGSNGGQSGSDVGCIPVCVMTSAAAAIAPEDIDTSSDVKFVREMSANAATTEAKDANYLFETETSLFGDPDATEELGTNSVRVDSHQNDCILVNAAGDKID